jgi:hypothetical protein
MLYASLMQILLSIHGGYIIHINVTSGDSIYRILAHSDGMTTLSKVKEDHSNLVFLIYSLL